MLFVDYSLCIFCDPDPDERDVLYATSGITEADDQNNSWLVREEEWLRRITPFLPDNLLPFSSEIGLQGNSSGSDLLRFRKGME